jgi:hypothetical protein
VTELCSGQALADADDDADTDAAAAADKSNPYMSPFQGDTIKHFASSIPGQKIERKIFQEWYQIYVLFLTFMTSHILLIVNHF